jgi:putative DNA primase/helicase
MDLHETENNLQAIFAHHPFWQGRFWWDVVANRAYLDERQPLDIHYVRNEVSPWLGATMRMPIRHSTRVLEVMRSWAQRQPRDPIQEWLATLPDRDDADLKRNLLNTFLHKYGGAEDTPYTRFVSRVLIASLVQRAMVPGVQYRYVVVLEGEENVGKTRLLRLLGDRWHQEFPKSVEGKEAYMQLQGYWLVELGELDALKPAQESRIKMFISQQMDVWVPKYENDVLERPRRAILVGTTNEREYLKGEHGNTRYLPVWLDGPIQHAALAAVRDRLFTQAKHFLADHPDDWWAIPEEVETEVLRQREARREPSVFEDALRPFLLGRKRCTVAEAFEDALHIPQAQWNKRLEMEVTKAFKGLGWHRHVEWDSATKKTSRFWADVPQQKKEVPF